MSVDVLAVGAHPDDIELTIGGTVALLVRQGYKVVLADMTEGELGTRGTRDIRIREAEEATRILGALARENLKIPDGDVRINRENLEKVISLIRAYQPKILLIPHSVERHPDHVNTHHLCREAWFYAGLSKIETRREDRPQPPFRPDSYFEYMQWYEFVPTFIIDVTATHDVKLQAVRAHASQFHDPNNKEPETKLSRPDFLEVIETRARLYGERIGVRYGEPFYSYAPIGVTNLFDISTHKK